MEFKLSEPEKSASGFMIRASMKPQIVTRWENTKWVNEAEVEATLLEVQKNVVQLLYDKRNSWFSSPPSKSQLAKLMKGWDIKGLVTPPDLNKNYSGSQNLGALVISKDAIAPKWIVSVWEEATKISMPWISNENEEDELEELDDSREINIDTDSAPVHLTPHEDRDYRDRKFAAKERVKEARLKSHVAKRIAQRELRFFFENFTLEENESTFSDYDLTDNDSEEEYEEEEEEEEKPQKK